MPPPPLVAPCWLKEQVKELWSKNATLFLYVEFVKESPTAHKDLLRTFKLQMRDWNRKHVFVKQEKLQKVSPYLLMLPNFWSPEKPKDKSILVFFVVVNIADCQLKILVCLQTVKTLLASCCSTITGPSSTTSKKQRYQRHKKYWQLSEL